ncbi:MAG: hypothetical protein HZA01_03300 [Nitrospinae bacterium]|nr:hypothetical protein [Nitrospinota bacterium]
MNNRNSKANKNDLTFQHYLIVFLDILGQRRTLREIKDLPTNENEKEIFLDKIRKTVGKVDVLRNTFRDFFNASNSHVPNTGLVPPEHREEFIASQKSEAYFYGFSDSIIVAVPLMNNDENCTAINGVYSALVATCGIGFVSLAATIALRAGLDIGIGTKIEGHEIYGPALERAHFIESNLAEYPRFVVGKELINYLLGVENQQCNTRLGVMAKGMAKLCKEMIIRDTDGRFMLDFMGEKSKEAADDSINAKVVKLARDFVVSQHQKYVNDENEKLASRYFRLLKYINSREKIWGVE